jgi:hypothetical protein
VAQGTPWRAYSWSNELLYALVERWQGERGLAIAQLVLGVVLVGALQLAYGLLSRSYFLGALLGAFTAVACYAHFSLRPQTVTWILFAWLVVLVDRCASLGLSWGRLVGVAVLGCVWANSHLSAVLGLVALVGWALQSWKEKTAWKRAVLLVGCFLVGTTVSPYGGGEWLTLFQKMPHVVSFRSIDEFKPADLLQHSTGFILIQLALLVMLCWSRHVAPAASVLVVSLLFVLLGGAVAKFLPFAAIVLSAATAVWWRENGGSDQAGHGSNQLVESIYILRRRFARLTPSTYGAIGFFLFCLAATYVVRMTRTPVNEAATPKIAFDFMEAHQLQGPVLNPLGSGGYLMYRWSSPEGEPRERVTLDGRTNLITAERWHSYQRALLGREGWSEYIKKVGPRTILWRNDSPLVPLLLESPEWCRVFQSGNALLDYTVFITVEEWRSRAGSLPSNDCVQG